MEAIKYKFRRGGEPREKLEKKGARALSDEELLMILLGQGNASRSVEDISGDVLALIDRGIPFPLSALMNIPGVGRAKGATILAAMEFGRRKTNRKPKQYNHHCDIYQEIRHYANREQEQLLVISMNAAFEILNIHTASIGYVDKAFFHPREIFSSAIKECATQIVIAHNHPSGSLLPSKEDISGTTRIIKAGRILGIPVTDHLIFTRDSYYSFYDSGTLKSILEQIEKDDI